MGTRWPHENDFDEIIGRHSAQFGIPFDIVKATVATESGFDPKAYRAEPKIKDASRGLMQLLEATARGLGFKGQTDDLFDPEISVHLGVKLLAQLFDRYGVATAPASIYAAYNAGSIRYGTDGKLVNQRNVDRWQKNWEYFLSRGAPAGKAGPCRLCLELTRRQPTAAAGSPGSHSGSGS